VTYCEINMLSHMLRQMVFVASNAISSFNIMFIVVIFRVEEPLRLCYRGVELDPISACWNASDEILLILKFSEGCVIRELGETA